MKKWIASILLAALVVVTWDANHENRGLRQLVFETWLGVDLTGWRLKECETLHLQNVCN
jgi:hypothetical protein